MHSSRPPGTNVRVCACVCGWKLILLLQNWVTPEYNEIGLWSDDASILGALPDFAAIPPC